MARSKWYNNSVKINSFLLRQSAREGSALVPCKLRKFVCRQNFVSFQGVNSGLQKGDGGAKLRDKRVLILLWSPLGTENDGSFTSSCTAPTYIILLNFSSNTKFCHATLCFKSFYLPT
ncbi:hypothetical protein SAY87_005858 [Trapa incisa]|uniref:Uncharacterized protein n=1 Tax=Trapa incisa TaxID=236973 RepID=A0AAN7K5G0_9MYRT|nr:hypothetical protein SAY87_005858 [Trapa incisa]